MKRYDLSIAVEHWTLFVDIPIPFTRVVAYVDLSLHPATFGTTLGYRRGGNGRSVEWRPTRQEAQQ